MFKITISQSYGSNTFHGLRFGDEAQGWEADVIYTDDEVIASDARNRNFRVQIVDKHSVYYERIKLGGKLKKYKIIPFVPAGRERTMRLLLRYFEKHRPKIDHVMIWVNTRDKDDLKYLKSIQSDFYRLYELPEGCTWQDPKQLNTSRFFQYCVDPKAIYIRFDDDIVFVDDNYFDNICKFTADNPQYLCVFGNIWNNAIISYHQQKEGNLDLDGGEVLDEFCMDEVGWGDPKFAEHIHNVLLAKVESGDISRLYLKKKYELASKKFSVSNFAIRGEYIKQFDGVLPIYDEEQFWTVEMPKRAGTVNAICGNALVSHFSFFRQREHLLKNTDILKRYDELSKTKLADSYYDLLKDSKD